MELISPREAVERAKQVLKIEKPNEELTYNEVKKILRVIISNVGKPTRLPNNIVIIDPDAVPMTMLIARVMFPQYSDRLGLT